MLKMQEVMNMEKLMTTGQVAKALNISRERVLHLRLVGRIRAVRVGCYWLHDAESVEAFRRERDAWHAKRRCVKDETAD